MCRLDVTHCMGDFRLNQLRVWPCTVKSKHSMVRPACPLQPAPHGAAAGALTFCLRAATSAQWLMQWGVDFHRCHARIWAPGPDHRELRATSTQEKMQPSQSIITAVVKAAWGREAQRSTERYRALTDLAWRGCCPLLTELAALDGKVSRLTFQTPFDRLME